MNQERCAIIGCAIDAAYVLTVLSSEEPSMAFCAGHIVSAVPAFLDPRSRSRRLRRSYLLELDPDVLDPDEIHLIVEQHVKDAIRLQVRPEDDGR